MHTFPPVLLLFFASTALSLRLFELEKRFSELMPKRANLSLPAIDQTPSLNQELQQYRKRHEEPEFADFKPDPQLSCQVLLQRNSHSQSIFLTGRQLYNLLLEVTVQHVSSAAEHEPAPVSVYLIDWSSGEFLLSTKVKHLNLFRAEVSSQLYEVRVEYEWPEGEDSVGEGKHITLNMELDPPRAAEKAGKSDGQAALEELRQVRAETDRIFMDSLEIWEEIGAHHKEFQEKQEQVYWRSWVELVSVVGLSLVEVVLMRRTLKLRNII